MREKTTGEKRSVEERDLITLVWREADLSAVLSQRAFPSPALIKDKPACTYHDMPCLALMGLTVSGPKLQPLSFPKVTLQNILHCACSHNNEIRLRA